MYGGNIPDFMIWSVPNILKTCTKPSSVPYIFKFISGIAAIKLAVIIIM